MRNIKFLILIFLITIIPSCKDSSTSIPVIPLGDNFIYPLNIGNKWDYNASVEYLNIIPDSVRHYLNSYSINLHVSVTRDTILNSVPVYEIKEESQDNPDSYSYYSNEEAGFIKYAYSNNPSLMLPKINKIKKIIYKGNPYNSIDELIKKQEDITNELFDSIIFLDPPRIIYKHPLEIGQEWLLNSSYIKINKKVIGEETLKTYLGSFECLKIQRIYFNSDGTIDNDFTYYEYVSSKGLLKIEIELKNVGISTIDHPDGIGQADVKYERIITGINF